MQSVGDESNEVIRAQNKSNRLYDTQCICLFVRDETKALLSVNLHHSMPFAHLSPAEWSADKGPLPFHIWHESISDALHIEYSRRYGGLMGGYERKKRPCKLFHA